MLFVLLKSLYCINTHRLFGGCGLSLPNESMAETSRNTLNQLISTAMLVQYVKKSTQARSWMNTALNAVLVSPSAVL